MIDNASLSVTVGCISSISHLHYISLRIIVIGDRKEENIGNRESGRRGKGMEGKRYGKWSEELGRGKGLWLDWCPRLRQ